MSPASMPKPRRQISAKTKRVEHIRTAALTHGELRYFASQSARVSDRLEFCARHQDRSRHQRSPWTSGQVERMNRTIKDTVSACFTHESHSIGSAAHPMTSSAHSSQFRPTGRTARKPLMPWNRRSTGGNSGFPPQYARHITRRTTETSQHGANSSSIRYHQAGSWADWRDAKSNARGRRWDRRQVRQFRSVRHVVGCRIAADRVSPPEQRTDDFSRGRVLGHPTSSLCKISWIQPAGLVRCSPASLSSSGDFQTGSS